MYVYNEFLLTRSTAEQGWGMVSCSNTANFPVDEKIKRNVKRIQNRFEYCEYKIPGYFLFYDEGMKRYYCAQASLGKAVDRRINMSIVVRVPDIEEGDGFVECVSQICTWEGIDAENLSANEICEKYGIQRVWLEQFTQELYKQSFTTISASQIGIMNSAVDGGKEETIFVTNMMKLCYFLLPSSKLLRLSFGWRIPTDGSKGVRILFSQKKEIKKTFDVATMLGEKTCSKDSAMIARIVRETLAGSGSIKFQDKIDQYHFPSADYNSMCWNYYYYILDKDANFQCSIEEFDILRRDMEKHMQSEVDKSDLLYNRMVASLSRQGLKQEDVGNLLNHYLGVCQQRKDCTNEDLTVLWGLLIQYTDNCKHDIEEILSTIKVNAKSIYYELVKSGIEKSYIDVDYLQRTENIATETEIEHWIEDSYNQVLLEETKVSDMLMGKLGALFEQNASMERIKRIISLGYQIDKGRCGQILNDYLVTGVRNAIQDFNMVTLDQYLKNTEALWRNVKAYRVQMECAYEQTAYYCKMPVSLAEIEAFVSIEWDFDNKQTVQKELMRKCREFLERMPEGNADLEDGLELLVHWNTGLSNTDRELVQCQALLEKFAGAHVQKKFKEETLQDLLQYQAIGTRKANEYSVWLEYLDKQMQKNTNLPLDEILEQLEKKRIYLSTSASKRILKRIFARMLECESGVKKRLEILDAAEQYLDAVDISSLMEIFWNKTKVKDFVKIRRYSDQIWKKRDVANPLLYNIKDNIRKNLYDIYIGIYSKTPIESISREIKMYLGGEDRKITEEFLCMMLLEWVREDGVYFERILDVLMVCWEKEDELFEKINELVEDKKKARQLIRKVRLGSFMDGSEKEAVPKEGDMFWGTILGIIMAMLTLLWNVVLLVDSVFFYIIMPIVISVMLVCAQMLYLSLEKKGKKFNLRCICFAGIVWSVLIGCYGLVGKNMIAMCVLLIALIVLLTIYWLIVMKKKKEN